MRSTAMPAMTSRAMSSTLAKPSPSPRALASQARPRPAARPPSRPPHWRRGCWAACCWPGAAGCWRAASRWVTWLDWRPADRPPPRRAASASKLNAASSAKASASAMRRMMCCRKWRAGRLGKADVMAGVSWSEKRKGFARLKKGAQSGDSSGDARAGGAKVARRGQTANSLSGPSGRR